MQYAKEEYDRQIQDMNAIETRASFLLILFVPILTILTETGKVLFEKNVTVLHFVFFIFALLLFLLCSVLIILTITVNKAKKVRGEDLVSNEFHDEFQEYFEAQKIQANNSDREQEKFIFSLVKITMGYNHFTSLNQNSFLKKCKSFKIACWLTIADLTIAISSFLYTGV